MAPRRWKEGAGQRAMRTDIKVLYCFHQNNDDSKCEVAHTSPPMVPGYRSQERNMAPKPASARFAYVFGMVLAVAAIILGITTRNLAAPSASLIYLPDLPLLY